MTVQLVRYVRELMGVVILEICDQYVCVTDKIRKVENERPDSSGYESRVSLFINVESYAICLSNRRWGVRPTEACVEVLEYANGTGTLIHIYVRPPIVFRTMSRVRNCKP